MMYKIVNARRYTIETRRMKRSSKAVVSVVVVSIGCKVTSFRSWTSASRSFGRHSMMEVEKRCPLAPHVRLGARRSESKSPDLNNVRLSQLHPGYKSP